MKRSHAGAALSLLAHAMVAAVVAMRWPQPRPVTTPRAAAPPASELIEIQLVEPLVIRERVGTVGPTGDHHRLIRPRPTGREAYGVAGLPSHSAPSGATAHEAALPSIRVSADRLAEAIARPSASRDERGQPSAAHSTFDVHVAPDGTAHITDRPNLQGGGLDRRVQREVSRDEAWLEQHHQQSNAVDMKMPRVGATVATFDVTDWAMRAAGQDPYASAKLKVLDETRAARVELGAHQRDQELVRIPALVRANLAEIERLPADRRKAALVELWRDCDDSTAGALARTTIEAYVRAAPVFTAEERAALHLEVVRS
ncbi:MAG: hypothetical protein ABI678_21965 [Kofleriaceae bacterium]